MYSGSGAQKHDVYEALPRALKLDLKKDETPVDQADGLLSIGCIGAFLDHIMIPFLFCLQVLHYSIQNIMQRLGSKL